MIERQKKRGQTFSLFTFFQRCIQSLITYYDRLNIKHLFSMLFDILHFFCVGCSRFSKYFLFHFCLISNDVIDCVLTLISQSEDYLVILQDESQI